MSPVASVADSVEHLTRMMVRLRAKAVIEGEAERLAALARLQDAEAAREVESALGAGAFDVLLPAARMLMATQGPATADDVMKVPGLFRRVLPEWFDAVSDIVVPHAPAEPATPPRPDAPIPPVRLEASDAPGEAAAGPQPVDHPPVDHPPGGPAVEAVEAVDAAGDEDAPDPDAEPDDAGDDACDPDPSGAPRADGAPPVGADVREATPEEVARMLATLDAETFSTDLMRRLRPKGKPVTPGVPLPAIPRPNAKGEIPYLDAVVPSKARAELHEVVYDALFVAQSGRHDLCVLYDKSMGKGVWRRKVFRSVIEHEASTILPPPKSPNPKGVRRRDDAPQDEPRATAHHADGPEPAVVGAPSPDDDAPARIASEAARPEPDPALPGPERPTATTASATPSMPEGVGTAGPGPVADDAFDPGHDVVDDGATFDPEAFADEFDGAHYVDPDDQGHEGQHDEDEDRDAREGHAEAALRAAEDDEGERLVDAALAEAARRAPPRPAPAGLARGPDMPARPSPVMRELAPRLLGLDLDRPLARTILDDAPPEVRAAFGEIPDIPAVTTVHVPARSVPPTAPPGRRITLPRQVEPVAEVARGDGHAATAEASGDAPARPPSPDGARGFAEAGATPVAGPVAGPVRLGRPGRLGPGAAPDGDADDGGARRDPGSVAASDGREAPPGVSDGRDAVRGGVGPAGANPMVHDGPTRPDAMDAAAAEASMEGAVPAREDALPEGYVMIDGKPLPWAPPPFPVGRVPGLGVRDMPGFQELFALTLAGHVMPLPEGTMGG